jgi:hypothetical protein
MCVQRPTIKAGAKVIMGKNTNSKEHSHPNRPIQLVQANDADTPEDQQPKVARLSVGGLLYQGRFIREICRDAIRIVETTLVTQQAWPELHKGTLYKRQVLLEAVNGLRANLNLEDSNDRKQDVDYQILRNRILEDDKFTRIIGKWVRNHAFQSSSYIFQVHVHY